METKDGKHIIIDQIVDDYIKLRKSGQGEVEAWNNARTKARDMFAEYLRLARTKLSTWEAKQGYGAKLSTTTMNSMNTAVTTGEFGQPEELREFGETSSKRNYLAELEELGLASKEQPAPKPQPTDNHFPDGSRLVVYIENHSDPILLKPRNSDELLIGIRTPGTAQNPDIDLTYFDGAKHGVSEQHAILSKRDDLLVITDLHSTNQTYLNGRSLNPNQPYPLSNGDEIHFGRLLVKLEFRVVG